MLTKAGILRDLSAAVLVAALSSAGFGQAAAPVAKVNGEAITLAEVEAILKTRPLRFVKLTEADRRDMQREALDMLIDDLVMDQFLRKNAPAIPAVEVNKKLQELQAGLKLQGQTMDDYCRESGQTEAQVRAAILSLLRRNAFLATHLTDAAVRKYYDDNRLLFDHVAVRASHILLRLSPNCAPGERAAAEAKLESLRQEILAGKRDFAEAAKAFSQCPSAPYGGDIGYFLRKGMVDEAFARAAFALNKGAVSALVQTSDGLHLIKVTDRMAGTPSDFAKVEGQVRDLAGAELMLNLLAEQRPLARIEVDLGDETGAKGNAKERRSLLTGRER